MRAELRGSRKRHTNAFKSGSTISTGLLVNCYRWKSWKLQYLAAISDLSATNWERASRAIMTTDTVPKLRRKVVTLEDGRSCQLVGMSKGSGMIQPNMATMLGFIATDATISREMLDGMLRTAVNVSFNRITVDGDTSTNDAVTLTATGQSDLVVTPTDRAAALAFQTALTELATELAQDIVRDGEGATKFVEITVSSASSEAEADQVARTVAHSPLVKPHYLRQIQTGVAYLPQSVEQASVSSTLKQYRCRLTGSDRREGARARVTRRSGCCCYGA